MTTATIKHTAKAKDLTGDRWTVTVKLETGAILREVEFSSRLHAEGWARDKGYTLAEPRKIVVTNRDRTKEGPQWWAEVYWAPVTDEAEALIVSGFEWTERKAVDDALDLLFRQIPGQHFLDLPDSVL